MGADMSTYDTEAIARTKGQTAYELACADPGLSWGDIAKQSGSASARAANVSALWWARVRGLPPMPRRYGRQSRKLSSAKRGQPRLQEEACRPGQAYAMRIEGHIWITIAEVLGYSSRQSAHEAARAWQRANGMPWPPQRAGVGSWCPEMYEGGAR